MKKDHLRHSIFYLPVMFLGFTSCEAQIKTDQAKTRTEESASIPSAQSKLVKTHGTDQYDQVRCGIQDRAGNLWFGTTGEGVYRYDGKSFTNFTTREGLCSNTIWSVLEDKSGNIWLGTDSGLCCYTGKKFVPVPILAHESTFDLYDLPGNHPSENPNVWCMLLDRSGKIWLGTSAGVYSYNGTVFTRLKQNGANALALTTIGYMLEDKNGNLWLGSGMPAGSEGLCRYNPTSGELASFQPGGEVWIRYLVEDKNGTIWFGTRLQGNWCYDGKNFTHYTGKEGIGAPVVIDQKGNTWFTGEEHDNGYGSKGGVWSYDGKEFKNFTTKEGMGDYSVWCIVPDREGNIWFGTRNVGLYKYDGKTFTSFSE